MMERTIVITGGHHTTAMAVMDELTRVSKLKYDLKYYWFGHKYSMWGDKNESAEFREITNRGINFIDLKAGKFHRTYNPLKLLLIPLGFFQSFITLLLIRPNIVVCFGGYLSVPVAISGWLLRIPVVTHEQTLYPGLANRFISLFIKKILVSFEETVPFFPRSKVKVTGNPIRKEIFLDNRTVEFSSRRRGYPTIYVTGGKQGSNVINCVVREALTLLMKKFNLIHQSGFSSSTRDYENLKSFRETLPSDLKEGYIIKEYYGTGEIGSVYKKADIIVSRSGANTISEIAALGKPAILIPLPNSSGGEQEIGANKLVETGLAIKIDQKDLTPEHLYRLCFEMWEHIDSFRQGGARAGKIVRSNAASLIADEIIKIID